MGVLRLDSRTRNVLEALVMPSIRVLLLTILACLLPAAALAQTAPASVSPSAPQTVPPPPVLTQDVNVAEPDANALKPPAAPANTMPHWSEFPRTPKNVPTVKDFASRVRAEEASSAQLDAIGRAIVWEAFEPAAITAAINAQIDPVKMGPVDEELTAEQSEALAKALRGKATAPPVAQ